MKKLNLDWGAISIERVKDFTSLNEFCRKAYESASMYKEKMKKYRDQPIEKSKFVVGDRLRLFLGKLKYKWSGPFLLK